VVTQAKSWDEFYSCAFRSIHDGGRAVHPAGVHSLNRGNSCEGYVKMTNGQIVLCPNPSDGSASAALLMSELSQMVRESPFPYDSLCSQFGKVPGRLYFEEIRSDSLIKEASLRILSDWTRVAERLESRGYTLRFYGTSFSLEAITEQPGPLSNDSHPHHMQRFLELCEFVADSYLGARNPLYPVCTAEVLAPLVTTALSKLNLGGVLTIGPGAMLPIRFSDYDADVVLTFEKVRSDAGVAYQVTQGQLSRNPEETLAKIMDPATARSLVASNVNGNGAICEEGPAMRALCSFLETLPTHQQAEVNAGVPISIGRNRACDVILEGASVSRHPLTISQLSAGSCYVQWSHAPSVSLTQVSRDSSQGTTRQKSERVFLLYPGESLVVQGTNTAPPYSDGPARRPGREFLIAAPQS
jgi:hypothetical protein